MMRLFNAAAKTIVAYGVESVPMTTSLCQRIYAPTHQMVWTAFDITFPEAMSIVKITLISLLCDPQASNSTSLTRD